MWVLEENELEKMFGEKIKGTKEWLNGKWESLWMTLVDLFIEVEMIPLNHNIYLF